MKSNFNIKKIWSAQTYSIGTIICTLHAHQLQLQIKLVEREINP